MEELRERERENMGIYVSIREKRNETQTETPFLMFFWGKQQKASYFLRIRRGTTNTFFCFLGPVLRRRQKNCILVRFGLRVGKYGRFRAA